MRKLFCLLGIVFSIAISAQSSVDALIVKNSGDTIRTQIKLRRDLFNKTIDPLSLHGIINLNKGKKKKGKIKEADIRHIEFKDFLGNDRVFVSNLEEPSLDIKNNLFEQKFKGKISWYVNYYPVVIDGNTYVESNDFFVKDGKAIKTKVFSGSYKKYLTELVDNDPKISEMIDEIRYDENDILEVLKTYNEK